MMKQKSPRNFRAYNSSILTLFIEFSSLDIIDMGVSKNRDTPKSSILIGFSHINNPFWGAPIFGNTHIQIWPNSPVF